MATDLATLAIKVDNGDVIKTTTSLNSMEVAGTKAEASTQRLTRRMALLEIQAREMDAAMAKSATTSGRLAAALNVTQETAAKLGIAIGALSAVAAVGFIGRKLIEETEAAQAAMAQLEAAVTATGGVAGRTVAQLDELSLALQKTTVYSDEAVKGAESILLTFDKIRGDNFDRATQAVTDLAARMGGDLQGAALQVGKALQDPANGLAALRRAGVVFSEAQKDVITDLVNTGKTAEAQQIILQGLEQRFSGSAAAARDTLGGAIKGLSNDFGDLFERTKDETSALVGFIHATDDVVKGLHDHSDAAKAVAEAVGGIAVAYGLASIAAKSFAVQAVLGGAATAAEGLVAALTGVGTAGTVALGPIALLGAAGALAIYDLNAAFDDYDDKVEEASKNTKEYVEYLKALGRAHAHGPDLTPPESGDLSDEARKFAALTEGREAELGKLKALNGAYRESAVALQILGIQYDAQIQKSQDAKEHHGRELAVLDALTDKITKQKIAQVLLNDQLERENALRAARSQNAAAVRDAQIDRAVSGLDAPTAERARLRLKELADVQTAEEEYQNKTRRATAQQRADAKTVYDETVARIHKVADLNDDAITRAREAATKTSVGLTVADAEAQTNAIRAMAAAELQGGKAAEQMAISLAGQDAVQRAVNDATARGTTVTDEQKDALRRSAEEMQRAQIEAAKLQAVFNQVSGAANQFFTDVFNRKNPFPGLAQRIKEELIAALSDAVARPITVTIAKIIGIDVESKQEKAAKVMNEAADKQLRAAQIMNGGDTSSVPGGAPPQASAVVEKWKQAMGIVGAGAIGYGTGYGIGQGTGSGVLGALGGAVAGAKAGAVFGAPGAIVGAIAGFAGGILGAGDAAKEAAAKLEAARISFKNSWDAIVAEINGDSLAQAIANANDRFQQLAQQYADTLTVEDIIHGKLATGLANINALQQEYVDGLKREAAAKARTQIESYRERELRAEGRNAEADALHAQEERQQLIDSFGKDIDATEQQILAAYDAAAAAEKNAAAVDRNTAALVSLHNAPQGFKYQQYLYDYGTPRPPTFAPSSPNFPQSPLGGGLQLSRGSKTYNVTFVIDGTKTTRAQAQQIANEFKRVANETLGSNADASDGMNMLVS